MKQYKITSKVYVSMNVPVNNNQTLSIPKKGNSITYQCQELPEVLETYEKRNLISVEEIV